MRQGWHRQYVTEAPKHTGARVSGPYLYLFKSASGPPAFFRGGRADLAQLRALCPLPDTADELRCVAKSLGGRSRHCSPGLAPHAPKVGRCAPRQMWLATVATEAVALARSIEQTTQRTQASHR